MGGYTGIPQNLPYSYRCANHPDREGVGICVSCRSVICVECSTKIDRMNYCIRCLQAARQTVQEQRRENPVADTALGIPLLIVSFLATAGVFGALGLVLALLRQ
jgi:hypothetical protein